MVHPGRADDGTLAAVYVIRGESAGDPAFRARFARETQPARRVANRWVVPVLGADGEAAEPWLATAFLPVPSLVGAVAEHGPLPSATVRSLGRLLAEALTESRKPGCRARRCSGSVRDMSSPESDESGAFGHAVSPLNH
ncbi:hypothetical protein [Streptomyces sp. NPDC002779]|uniref:hypothetical protein n=1 Tax=Streptomyces sp. NPDC002779 TaxID=3364664 RepID=UPI003673958C